MDDDMSTLEALDRWIEDDEGGVIPTEVLEERGFRLTPANQMDDIALHEQLWAVIQAMAEIGMYLEDTNHLSDRELYEHLEKVLLREETFLAPDDPRFGTHCDVSSAEDAERDETYDRDRFLPTHEERAFGTMKVV